MLFGKALASGTTGEHVMKGGSSMKVEQISIFLENKPGGLEEVTRILKDAEINIRTLSLADTSDFGILRLIVNDVETASRVLKENGFRFSRTTVVAVEVPDRPGGLHGILEVARPKTGSTWNICTPSWRGAVKTP